jgi:hypothetical protein
VAPEACDVRVTAEGTPWHWAEKILARLRPTFDPPQPKARCSSTAINRSMSDRLLIEEGLRRVGQARIAVRDTHGTDAKNPLSFFVAVVMSLEATSHARLEARAWA